MVYLDNLKIQTILRFWFPPLLPHSHGPLLSDFRELNYTLTTGAFRFSEITVHTQYVCRRYVNGTVRGSHTPLHMEDRTTTTKFRV